MEKIKQTFTECSIHFLEKTFGLRQIAQEENLSQWLTISKGQQLNGWETQTVDALRKVLNANVTSWNEQDLSLHFIGPMFSFVNFTEPYRFNLFAERSIAAEVHALSGDVIELSGKPDEMIASGYREPEAPFFCFQEYKREKDPNGDPAGQVLASMLVGQSLSEKPRPIYGCYVIGRDWYFLTLINKAFCITRDYSAITDDAFEIFKILKGLKVIINGMIA
jgi:hypothetical protein